MMDELELLKSDWQKREGTHPKLSYDEIYRMIWKRSSSIVKWIMIISILEFALPHLLYLIPGTSKSLEIYDKLGIKNMTTVFFALGYLVIFYFIYQFYSRYREISSVDNSKVLMEKILRTRSTVMHYVIFSLSMLLAMCIMVIVAIYFSDNLYEIFDIPDTATKVSPGKIEEQSDHFHDHCKCAVCRCDGRSLFFALWAAVAKAEQKLYGTQTLGSLGLVLRHFRNLFSSSRANSSSCGMTFKKEGCCSMAYSNFSMICSEVSLS